MNALLGGLLGLVAGGLSVASLWLITGFAARAARGLRMGEPAERVSGWDEAPTGTRWDVAPGDGNRSESAAAAHPSEGEPSSESRRATLRLFGAFLLKAPLLVLIAYGAQKLGTVAVYWCVGGVVLVYCFAVFWAAGRTHRL